MSRNFHSETGIGLLDRPSSDETAAFVEAITGEPVSRGCTASEACGRPNRHQLQWLAEISLEHEIPFRNLLREEALAHWPEPALEDWDDSKHPRLGGPPNAGWFASTGGSDTAIRSRSDKRPKGDGLVRKLPSGPQILAQVAPAAQAPAWPTISVPGAALPKVGGAAAVGAAGAAAGAAQNAAMAGYWTVVPGVQGMQERWVYELEKRVQAGTLSREDAVGIFQTAVLGAAAQGFRPSGNTHAAVRDSMMDFLGKAEAVYFARKKEKADAARPAGAETGRVTGEALDKSRKEFEAMKPRLWKEEAESNPHQYTDEQLERMRVGKAPIGSDGKPMEIHHKKPLSEGGTNTRENFEFKTQTEHRLGPNLQKNHPNLPRGRRS